MHFFLLLRIYFIFHNSSHSLTHMRLFKPRAKITQIVLTVLRVHVLKFAPSVFLSLEVAMPLAVAPHQSLSRRREETQRQQPIPVVHWHDDVHGRCIDANQERAVSNVRPIGSLHSSQNPGANAPEDWLLPEFPRACASLR